MILTVKKGIDIMMELSYIFYLILNGSRPHIYILQIESRLEDLAGNNLNRLFELILPKSGSPLKIFIKDSLRSGNNNNNYLVRFYIQRSANASVTSIIDQTP